MTKRHLSLVDHLIDQPNQPKTKPPPPVCPLCEAKGQTVSMLQQGLKGWRCPQCLLAMLPPVPSKDELPELQRCPQCAKQGRIQIMVWLDWGWQWCRTCNNHVQVLSPGQQASSEGFMRAAVGGCYGGPPPRKIKTANTNRRSRIRKGKNTRVQKRYGVPLDVSPE